MRSSNAALATSSCRARRIAAARTCTRAPTDHGMTSQLAHTTTSSAGRSSAGRWACTRVRDNVAAVMAAMAAPQASSEVRSPRRLATSNIANTMHSWIGPYG
jgi:hypothetical protein